MRGAKRESTCFAYWSRALVIDLLKLTQMIGNLESYVEVLQKAGSMPFKDYLRQDVLTIGGGRLYLQLAIQCCIDIANFLIAAQGFRQPTDAADAFLVLAQQQIISEPFQKTLQNMVGMRNILVHEYAKVDNAKVYEVIHGRLHDFEHFAQCVLNYARAEGALSETDEV